MIFPGMDPYLEAPGIWPDFHVRLIVHIAEMLQPLVRPRYFVATQRRVFIEQSSHEIIPDIMVRRQAEARTQSEGAVLTADVPVQVLVSELEIQEAFLAIYDRRNNRQVITVLEIVSPTNKYAGPGRDAYLTKQQEVRASQAHLVEIDLLRRGPHVLAIPERAARDLGPYDYLIEVNRAEAERKCFELYLCHLRKRLPRIAIPLAAGEADVILDVQEALEQTYAAGDFRADAAYDQPCVPALAPDDQAWADALIEKNRAPEERSNGAPGTAAPGAPE